jgi:hypothetical protein
MGVECCDYKLVDGIWSREELLLVTSRLQKFASISI